MFAADVFPWDGCFSVLVLLGLAMLVEAICKRVEVWRSPAARAERARRAEEARWRCEEKMAQRRRQVEERERVRRERIAEEKAARQKRAAEEAAERRKRTEETERRRKVAAAREHLERYYHQHAGLLQEEYPPELFQAAVAARFPDGIGVEQAWKEAHALIEELRPLVAAAAGKQKARADRLRKIDRQIGACRERIGRLKRSRGDADVIEDEVAAEQDRLATLLEEREQMEES